MEEINHALHAALAFRRGVREIRQRRFHPQSRAPGAGRYLPCPAPFRRFLPRSQRVSRFDRRWLRFHLFARQNARPIPIQISAGAISRLPNSPSHYTRCLDTLNGVRRIDEIRLFHALEYPAKKQRILALDGSRKRIGAAGFSFDGKSSRAIARAHVSPHHPRQWQRRKLRAGGIAEDQAVDRWGVECEANSRAPAVRVCG